MTTPATQLFDWPTAKQAMAAGWSVRRVGWTTQWLYKWVGGLYWLILNDGTSRVVQNTDFGAAEFLAQDWTNLPVSCVTAGTVGGTATNGCPLPFSPTAPVPPPVSPTTPTPSPSPSAPPPGWIGGGGGYGGSGPSTPPATDPPTITWPTISMTATDSDSCSAITGKVTATGHFTGTVTMSNPSGYTGPSVFLLSVRCGTAVVGGMTISPGGSTSFSLTVPNVVPGGTIPFQARAWALGSPDIVANTTASVADWCAVDDSFNVATASSGPRRDYSPEVITAKTFTNPYAAACTVTVSGSADDDVQISATGEYLLGGSSASDNMSDHPVIRSSVSFTLAAGASFTLTLYDTIGINSGCAVSVHFAPP